MTLTIDHADITDLFVDRSGTSCHTRDNRQGFRICLGGLTIEFEDEADAVELARSILDRMGEGQRLTADWSAVKLEVPAAG